MTSVQQSFDHLDLPVIATHLHKSISLLQHPAFSGSSSSLKSTDDNDMLSTQGDTVGEARAMVERWCSERVRDSTVELQAHNIMLDCMSPTPVDFSKPPRRFWRTSWRALTLKLCKPIDTRSHRWYENSSILFILFEKKADQLRKCYFKNDDSELFAPLFPVTVYWFCKFG